MIKLKIFARLCLKFGLLFSIKLELKKAFSKDLIAIKIKGYKNHLFLRKNTSDLNVFYQVFLNEEYKFKLKNEPKLIVDAGSNIGLAGIYFANKYPDAEIFCIEPEENNYLALCKNTKSYPKIKTIQSGIWSHDCELEIKDRGYGEWGFEVMEKVIKDNTGIKAISIDHILNQTDLKKIDVLKIDIEGSEKEVFSKNYNQWLSKTSTLIVETHDRMKKGTSHALFSAVINFKFSCEILGENFLFNFDEDE